MATCVVCGLEVEAGSERYANTWEAARKRFPCCSPSCSAAFDPSVHWIPTSKPEPASVEEEERLLAVARKRLRNGDSPTVLTREMLQAGVASPGIRKILNDGLVSSSRAAKDAAALSMFGGLAGLLTGMFFLGRNRDKRKPASIEDALADVDTWQAHFADDG